MCATACEIIELRAWKTALPFALAGAGLFALWRRDNYSARCLQMSYPNAFCVRCGSHTETMQKHTVVLQNSARALKGVCAKCESDVYKILPKGVSFKEIKPASAAEMKKYPDAYCVRCQKHTPTTNPHTVIMDNNSRAVTGKCQCCGSEVYRIISPDNKKALVEDGKRSKGRSTQDFATKMLKERLAAFNGNRNVPITRRAEDAARSPLWSFLAACAIILTVIAGFVYFTLG